MRDATIEEFVTHWNEQAAYLKRIGIPIKGKIAVMVERVLNTYGLTGETYFSNEQLDQIDEADQTKPLVL